MGQIGGHNVGLEDIDIHAYAHGLSAANGAHGGNGRLAVIERFAPEITDTIWIQTSEFSFWSISVFLSGLSILSILTIVWSILLVYLVYIVQNLFISF